MTKIILIVLIFLSYNTLESDTHLTAKKDKVEFLLDDKKIDIKDNFKIFILVKQDQ